MRVFIDLDGTTFDNSHRHHLMPKGSTSHTKDWEAFNLACIDDEPMHEILDMIFALRGTNIVITGRAEICRRETISCLQRVGLNVTGLVMRDDADHRKAIEFKAEAFQFYNVGEGDFVFEDDPKVIQWLLKNTEATVIAVRSKCAAVNNDLSQEGK